MELVRTGSVCRRPRRREKAWREAAAWGRDETSCRKEEAREESVKASGRRRGRRRQRKRWSGR
jgi:hypothetical protein